ncbi:hypothetical protein AMS69_10220 [Haloarcula rubripromontorii]|uniref:Uncharacterized protein n=1 Tax=Haloarcula rubripromontorii TaxID=1705562 RepID=A0A0M9AKR4_9EURY|nr:hypothetical protein AMS69_10220 [Haloarcula rubripromontorii]
MLTCPVSVISGSVALSRSRTSYRCVVPVVAGWPSIRSVPPNVIVFVENPSTQNCACPFRTWTSS